MSVYKGKSEELFEIQPDHSEVPANASLILEQMSKFVAKGGKVIIWRLFPVEVGDMVHIGPLMFRAVRISSREEAIEQQRLRARLCPEDLEGYDLDDLERRYPLPPGGAYVEVEMFD